jgi:glycosyltransferase involved in cell wall biosynthesis
MKIAFIVPALTNRGPIIVVKDIVDQIINSVDEVVVFYIDELEPELHFVCKTERVTFFNFRKKIRGFDIVHTHMLRPDIMLSLLSDSRVKKVSTLHNYIYNDISNTHNKVIAYIFEIIWVNALKKLNKVVCLTQHMKDYYEEQGIRKQKLEVIYNGRPPYNPDVAEGNQDDEQLKNFRSKYFVLGVSALLTPRKGVEQIVKVLKSFNDVGLVIIGDGPQRELLESIVSSDGISERCLFMGYKKDARKYFKYFDAYTMPSRSEGFPLALIEAASSRLPLLVSDLPLFKEILNEDEAVFVALDDEKSMIAGITYLKQNAQILAGKSLLSYNTKFNAAIMGHNYMALYKNLLSEN